MTETVTSEQYPYHRYFLWAVYYAAVIIIAVMPFLYDLPVSEKTVAITQMQFTPGSGEPSSFRALPDNWRSNTSSSESHATYTATFDLNQTPDNLWGIFIPAHRSNLSVTINDVYVGDGGSFEPHLARNGMRPIILAIPSGLLTEQNNKLEIGLYAAPAGHGFLDKIYIGSHSDLRPNYRAHYFWLQLFVQIITFSILVLGIVMLVIWLYQRHEKMYGLLSGMAIAWAVQSLNHIMTEIPVSLNVWEKIMHVSALWTSVFAYFFISSYFTTHIKREVSDYRKANFVYSSVLSIILAVLPMPWFYKIFYIFATPYHIILLVYILVQMVRIAQKSDNGADHLLAGVSLIGVVYTTHDGLVTAGVINSHVFYLITYFGFFVFLFFGWTLLKRFVETSRTLESANARLVAKVAEREAELQTVFEKQKEYERKAAMEKERERLMRDIHDGLGGQLVSILSVIEQDEKENKDIASAVRTALDDLRLIVNSLDAHNLSLPALLGLFRERIVSRYEKNGLIVHWDINPVTDPESFSPNSALQILRILQEAITNTVKHAKATEITVYMKEEKVPDTPYTVVISYADNGIGFDAEKQTSGYGLKNIHTRAAEAGIQISVTSDANVGSLLTLRL